MKKNFTPSRWQREHLKACRISLHGLFVGFRPNREFFHSNSDANITGDRKAANFDLHVCSALISGH